MIKRSKINIFLSIGFIFLGWSTCFSEIIFEDNFDGHDDWVIEQPVAPTAANAYQGESSILPGYHSYYIAGSYYANKGMNSLILDNSNFRGLSGKALTFWNESDLRGDGWASDNQIGIYLPKGYDEMYISFYIKFQPGWKWATTDADQKILRASHYHGDSPFKYFADGNQHPLANLNIVKFNSGIGDACLKAAYRYENVYFPDSATPSHKRSEIFYPPYANYVGTGKDFTDDTGWQCWELRLKMNSAPGVADGIYQFWINDELMISVTDLAWSDSGSQVSPRLNWNYVILGGNSFNHFAPNTAEAEQWYAVDDLIISTEKVGMDCTKPKVTENIKVQ